MTSTYIREVLNSISNIDVDLKGFSESQAEEFISSAFNVERELPEMIKITLIVGAGKEKRMKYEEDLQKWIITSLKNIGYTDDKTGATTFDSSGTFKYQHDTGKNLKFVHVFPRAKQVVNEANKGSKEGAVNGGASGVVEVESFPASPIAGLKPYEWKILTASVDEVKEFVDSKMPLWMHKKRCSDMIRTHIQKFLEVENKLALMKVLDDDENYIYTETEGMQDKLQLVVDAMKSMVDDELITDKEKNMIVKQIDSKIHETTVNDNIKGKSNGASKVEILKERKAKVSQLSPKTIIEICPLRNESRIRKLVKRTVPLDQLMEKAGPKGLWSTKLTPDEVHVLKELPTINEEIETLLKNQQKWFETDEEFAARVETVKKSARNEALEILKQFNRQKNSGSAAGGWSTTASRGKKTPDFSKAVKKGPSTGAFNSLLAVDSDSD